MTETIPGRGAPVRNPEGQEAGADSAPIQTPGLGQLGLAVIVVAAFMVVLDFSIVNVALPSIQRELGISDTAVQWVVTAYAIAFSGLLISLGGPATCMGGGACSWPGSACSPPPHWPVGSPATRCC
jgi:hypothetical protein